MILARVVGLAFAGAFAIRQIVEMLFGYLADVIEERYPDNVWSWVLKKVLPYIAFAGAEAFAFWYSLDFFGLLAGQDATTFGVVLTGGLIGGGVEVVHKFVFEFLLRDRLGQG